MARRELIELDNGRAVTVLLSRAIQARYAAVLRRADTAGPDGQTDPTLLSLALVEHGPSLTPGHVVGWSGYAEPFTAEAWLDEPMEVQALVYATALGLLFDTPEADAVLAAGGDPTPPATGPPCMTGSPS